MFGQITRILAITGLSGLMNSAISNAKSFAKLIKDYGIGLAQSTNIWLCFVANRSPWTLLAAGFCIGSKVRGVFA